MARTNIDIDEDACAAVMQVHGLTTEQDAVNFALRQVADAPLSLTEARGMRGKRWEGDLDRMDGEFQPPSKPDKAWARRVLGL